MILRVVTLNCWALPQPWPIGSKHRKFRLEKLVEALNETIYDVVSLQEIWSEADYQFISKSLEANYPHSHYFHSGFTGSGVCVISRHPIVSTLMHRYSLNGFAHHVHRGDWFGGKVVGMVLLSVRDVYISFYTTHLHAEYDRKNDLFLPHRLSQALELSQFVKHTSAMSHCAILTGDFNIEPEDLGYRLIVNNGNLKDSWLERPDADKRSGMTCDRPDNCFTPKYVLKEAPEGKRLDYIMFKSGKAHIELTECDNTLGKIPDSTIDYSDHLGVHSVFNIVKDDSGSSPTCVDWKTENLERSDEILHDAVDILEGGELRALWDRRLYLAVCVILIAMIIATIVFEVHFSSSYFTAFATIGRFFLTLVFGFCLWYGIIGLTMELKALKAAKISMQKLLNEAPSSALTDG
uniref:sphingomyelin phosphodiesterase n=1 Tax=Steinernema glaseri TaxID=37863 RepID=A0A1I7Y0R6_9BILA